MKNKTLPILLKNQKILLIGGGNVALQKAEVLAHNNISFKLISQELNKKILNTTIDIEKKSFKLKDIGDYTIIIDATGNKKVTHKLLKYKKEHNILLNVVDVPELCDFYFMALTKNRPLQIAVSSNGTSPTAAKYFRDECEALIPSDIAQYLETKRQERKRGFINVKRTKKELLKQKSKVFLLGCGLGEAELLTIKSYRIIQEVDVVLYDYLISKEIIDLIPKKTKKIYVGKQKDYHSKSQEEINKLIIKYAKKGLSVARLKSGDPFVFGRGAEELQELLKESIDTEVVAGISSSVSGTLMADIPITARGYAAGFSVVSAHLKGNSVNLDWIDLLNKKNHTIVVLMGLSRVTEIVKEAQRLKISNNKPCAIISNASRENQSVITGTLKDLKSISINAQRPAILVFGDVVKLNKILGKLR